MKKNNSTARWSMLCFYICISICSCAGASTGNSERKNLLDSMSVSEWKALNVFFSNFSETNMEDFNPVLSNDNMLVKFALSHNVFNGGPFKEDNEGYYLEESQVIKTIQKYFGIDKVTVPDGEIDHIITRAGNKFYWFDVLEGSPWFAGAQVIKFFDNEDGTFSAFIEVYGDNEKFQEDYLENFATLFYQPKHTWKANVTERCRITGYREAKIKIHNNRKLLLEWKEAELPGISIGMMEERNDENIFAEIPMIHYEGDNPELMRLNNDIRTNVMLPYKDFIKKKQEHESIEIKTHVFTNDGLIQFIITSATFPAYATEGDIRTYNYNKKNNEWISLESMLDYWGIEREFIEKDAANRFKAIAQPGESAKAVEVKGFCSINAEIVEFYLKILVENSNAEPWDGIFRYVCTLEGQELQKIYNE